MKLQRREFLSTAVTAGIASSFLGTSSAQSGLNVKREHQLRLAPHLGMFQAAASKDYPTSDWGGQLQFMAKNGFSALQDNSLLSRPIQEQQKLGSNLQKLNMKMGPFVGIANYGEAIFSSGRKFHQQQVLKQTVRAIKAAKRSSADSFIVVPGKIETTTSFNQQTKRALELLKQTVDLCEQAQVTMLLEPLNHWGTQPQLFLHSLQQAVELCQRVNSPSCKVVFDVYQQHQQGEDVLSLLESSINEIGHVQVGDSEGRKEPGTGQIDYRHIFKLLKQSRYSNLIGLEHGNSIPGKRGELAVIESYRKFQLV